MLKCFFLGSVCCKYLWESLRCREVEVFSFFLLKYLWNLCGPSSTQCVIYSYCFSPLLFNSAQWLLGWCVSTYCFNSVSYHALLIHSCVKLQVLSYPLSITLVVALTMVLYLKTQVVTLQQEVTPGEKNVDVNVRIKHLLKWKQIFG